ncbi:hypothetical protein TVAG_384740 [Trichomonas vaginalis G3]|uniref:Uncharacterized protein n=1 Tax=Trichomonas vaginalis (strain ATCC PRA-98 / G3) TaxID=412133 RepID=A2GE36_TRIV3|nr:hypothetical protein TVAG_384740 [Trichomonas vaginalis G3]|eukprot:XP_001297512.1 hypothetical protein [Trichomonas vaginalis G3]
MYASRTVKPNSIEYYLEKQEADTAIQSLIQNQAQENSKDSQFKSTSNSKQLKLDSNVLKPQPARTNTALRIDQRIPNKELRSRLKLQSDEYFSLNNQGNTPYNRIYTNTVKETITAYTKLCQLVPNQDQLTDIICSYLPIFAECVEGRTLLQACLRMPPNLRQQFAQIVHEFKAFNNGYDEDEVADEFGEEKTFFPSYNTPATVFPTNEFHNYCVVHLIVVDMPTGEDILSGDFIEVCINTELGEDELHKFSNVEHIFKPAHQLFIETEITLTQNMSISFKSKSGRPYRIWMNYVLLHYADDDEEEEERRRKKKSPPNSHQKTNNFSE